MSAAAAIESDLIARDVSCAGCGYNLRTLASDASCPECAVPVAQSLAAEKVPLRDPRWLKLMILAELIGFTQVPRDVLVLLRPYPSIARALREWIEWADSPTPFRVAWLTWLVVALLITARPSFDRSRTTLILRWLTRFGAIYGCLFFGIPALGQGLETLMPYSQYRVVHGSAQVFAKIGDVALALLLRRYALRAGWNWLAVITTAQAVWLLPLLGAQIAALLGNYIIVGALTPPGYLLSLEALSVVLSVCYLALFVTSWRRVRLLRVRFPGTAAPAAV